MAVDILSRYAVGGAQRPDSFSGLDPNFAGSLAKLFQSAPADIQNVLRVTSGFRSPQRQEQLWADALKKYGSPDKARKWVAPPGRSKHNHGSAVDLKFLDPRAREWAHQNAAQYGLHFPMAHEPWHVEPVGSRGGRPAPAAGHVQQANVMPSGPIGVAPGAMPGAAPAGAAPVASFDPMAGGPMAFADAITPRPPSTFGAVIEQFQRRRQAQAEAHEAEQTRRIALANELANLFS